MFALAVFALALVACGTSKRAGERTNPSWAGYAARGRMFSSAVARIRVPTVSCVEPDTNASFWVGLDGLANESVEQIGVGTGPTDLAGRRMLVGPLLAHA